MKKFIEWIKTNTSTIIITGLGAIFIYSQLSSAVRIDTHLKELKAQAEDVRLKPRRTSQFLKLNDLQEHAQRLMLNT